MAMEDKGGKGKINKRVFGVSVGLAALFLLAFLIRNIAFPSCPLSNDTTLDELRNMDLWMNWVDDGIYTDDELQRFYAGALDGAKYCENIFVVKPTGNIYFNRGLILQEVHVQKIIQGACACDRIWIDSMGSSLAYEDGKVLIQGRPFLEEDCEYLVFCDPSAANAYSDKKIFTAAERMWFGCYNLTRDGDIVVDGPQTRYDPQIEFYTTSKAFLDCCNAIKKQLVETYCRGY